MKLRGQHLQYRLCIPVSGVNLKKCFDRFASRSYGQSSAFFNDRRGVLDEVSLGLLLELNTTPSSVIAPCRFTVGRAAPVNTHNPSPPRDGRGDDGSRLTVQRDDQRLPSLPGGTCKCPSFVGDR